jgi:hypothetical protein
MRFASARCILWLLQQRRPVTSPLGVVHCKSMSGDRFHALAIDGGESVAAKVYHTRGKTAILEDPSANRLWIRIDQELRASRTANGSSILIEAPSGMESESRPRGDAEARGGDNPENQCACRLTWPIDDHAGARARQRGKFHQVLDDLATAIRDDPHIGVGFDAGADRYIPACDCTGRHASTNAPIRKRLRMVAQTVASRDGSRCEMVHIGQAVTRTDQAVAAQHAPLDGTDNRQRGCALPAPAQPSPVARR